MRRRAERVLWGALALLCVGLLMAAGTGWWAVDHYTSKVNRVPHAFPTDVPPGERPSAAKGGQTFLLVGVDSRSDLPTTGTDAKAAPWKPGAQRSDTMMLMHLPSNHATAYVVSLPRDTWVKVPGHGRSKLNAAFSWGGPPLLIDTVQRLTRVRVDHLAVIDWSGFRKLTDAVGGVELSVAGGPAEHMNGAEALEYVRERKDLPRGDLDRTHRQQNYLRAVLSKVLSGDHLTSPLRTKRLLDQLTATISVDDRLSDTQLRDLLWDSRGMRASRMVFMNAPVDRTATVGGQSVVLLDDHGSAALWKALLQGTMADYVREHRVDRLKPVVQ
ncbi:LCP family protein [Streptomyces pathocidini]|uniref:LCP family protein n=1 Tax=Streptomyces pathocidini TaxID=1650571 RepID=A0ABW7UQX2_9ACTN|nr:LCP family protein [Streptomyces pathocidini]